MMRREHEAFPFPALHYPFCSATVVLMNGFDLNDPTVDLLHRIPSEFPGAAEVYCSCDDIPSVVIYEYQ